MNVPIGLNRRSVRELLAGASRDRPIGRRIEAFSRRFLGRPYQPFPLIGSSDTPEVFVASLAGFDCVTYIETILALARATNVDSFIAELRRIRYAKGLIEWKQRNHYMTGWISNNLRDGVVGRISSSTVPTISRDRILDAVPGLPARRARVSSVPRRAIPRLAGYLRSGDLIFFASTRKHLDVFHTGIIVRDGVRILMRHASRSQAGVVELELGAFLQANRMAGVIVVRPRELAERSAGKS